MKGYTLVEMILVIVLLGIMASVGALAFKPALDSWTLGRSRMDLSASGDYALNRMISEMSQVKDAYNVSAASAGTFSFTDANSTAISYTLTGSNLMRNADILAPNIQTLSFSYWDLNNAAIASPILAPSSTNIWRISIQLSTSESGQTLNFQAQIHPRNLRRS